jgi:hypothetical protein
LTGEDPGVLWERYIQLTNIKAPLKTMKSELGLRPIYHQLGQRVETHILVAFLAYCLLVALAHGSAKTTVPVAWQPPRVSRSQAVILIAR